MSKNVIQAHNNSKVSDGVYIVEKGSMRVVRIKDLLYKGRTVKSVFDEMIELRKDKEQLDKITNGVAVTISNPEGYVVEAFKMPKGSRIVPLQDIPKEIGTKAYLVSPFYKDGFVKDLQKYRKYLAML